MSGLQLVFFELDEGEWLGGVMDVVMDTTVCGPDDVRYRSGRSKAA
ncbi:MAG: hypothetical protein ACPHID_08505 [Thermoplasmatota archaeon]